jgi:choline dehydrogenase-like flavoprotein
VVADFGRVPQKPGEAGVQIHYVASKPEDERFVLENAYLPPALMSSVVPGMGRAHREWMRKYKQLSMIATTIGSPQTGTIHANGSVYLRAGAARVGLAGVRSYDDAPAIFHPGDESSYPKLLDKVRRVAPSPDYLMMMSAHPQGGLRLGRDPATSAVSPDFHVHGVPNLMVADASLFPSTIVVNPQWTVMGLAWGAAERIEQQIASRRSSSEKREALVDVAV